MTPERKEESRALLEEYRTYEGAESFEVLRLLAVELLAALDEAEKTPTEPGNWDEDRAERLRASYKTWWGIR